MAKKGYSIKEVKWVDIKKVKLWRDNPRKNDDAAEKLAPLLAEHGFKSPLVVWTKDKTIYKGNTSYKAALINNMKKIPVAFVDFPSRTAAKAYAIADNKAGEFSEWDQDMLFDLMKVKELRKPDKTGFQEKEISDLLMMPNIDKLHGMEESTKGILATIKITCKPKKKEVIMTYLERTLTRKFPKDVVIT